MAWNRSVVTNWLLILPNLYERCSIIFILAMRCRISRNQVGQRHAFIHCEYRLTGIFICASADIYVIIDARNGMTANCSMSFPSSNDRGCFITKDLVTEYDDNLVGVAICLANSKQYYRIGENQYFTRLFKTKIKQLRLIGWQPVVVCDCRWPKGFSSAANNDWV